jgi:F-type H+-transporting ATPase subunit delta
LLGLAREAGTLLPTGEELRRATSTFERPELRDVVLNPGIGATTRRAIVGKVVDRLALSAIVGNLVRLLADRDRLAILPDVVRAYDAFVDRELGRTRATVRSASPLTKDELEQIERLARRLTGSQHAVVSTEVDPDLLGGVLLDVGGTVYDGSVRMQLMRLAGRMAGTA